MHTSWNKDIQNITSEQKNIIKPWSEWDNTFVLPSIYLLLCNSVGDIFLANLSLNRRTIVLAPPPWVCLLTKSASLNHPLLTAAKHLPMGLYNQRLFALHCGFQPICSFSSDLWDQQDIFVHTTAARWVCSLLETILWCDPITEAELLRPVHLAPTTMFTTFKVTSSHILPHCDAACHLYHVCVPHCIELPPCDICWWNICNDVQ